MQRRAIGNNPLAFAAPVAGRAPIVFDVANSEVAFGRIARAVQAGTEPVPETWAMDETDVRRDDARVAAERA